MTVWACVCSALLLVILGYASTRDREPAILIMVVSYMVYVLAMAAGALLVML